MKVLAATAASWLLWKAGALPYWIASTMFNGACRIEDWAGIGGQIKAGGAD